MKPDKKKDNLTDVVEQVSSEPSDKPATVGEGQVVSSGEVVTLGVDEEEITKVAKQLLKAVRKKK